MLGVWPSSVNAGGARLLEACTPKAAGAVGAGVLNTGTGLVSAEVAGRELDSSDTAGAGGCAADEGGWDATAAPVESGKGQSAYLATGGHLQPDSPSARHPSHCCKGLWSSTCPYQTDPALHTYCSSQQDHGLSIPKLATPFHPKTCLPALLPADHLNREFCHLPPTEATQNSLRACLALPKSHSAGPPPHLLARAQPGCSASSSGCPGVSWCWPGQKLLRQAQAPGTSW